MLGSLLIQSDVSVQRTLNEAQRRLYARVPVEVTGSLRSEGLMPRDNHFTFIALQFVSLLGSKQAVDITDCGPVERLRAMVVLVSVKLAT